MATFFMFGKYSPESMKQISADRTRRVLEIAREHGGEIKEMFAILGAYDLVLIAEFPELEHALKASVTITQEMGISFSTLPAIPVEEFDRLVKR